MAADSRWSVLEQAKVQLLALFAERGVVRIEYIAGWPDLEGVSVWLCTWTDVERDALGADNPAKAEVEAVLGGCGLDDRDPPRVALANHRRRSRDDRGNPMPSSSVIWA